MIRITDVYIHNVNMNEAICRIEDFIKNKRLNIVVTPNVDHIVKLQRDIEFKRIYEKASLILPDGMPIIWASKFLGTPLKERVAGSDLFNKLCEVSNKKGYRLFFLGGRPGAAEGASEILKEKFSDIQICGFYCPPFGFEYDEKENKKILKLIKDSKPDILFVGLGAPKQEKWIFSHYIDLGIPVNIGIGVTFEFVAGMVKRAPVWMQKTGFEWLWRLMMEPRRLWRRYLIEDMNFFYLILRQKFNLRYK